MSLIKFYYTLGSLLLLLAKLSKNIENQEFWDHFTHLVDLNT